jgi:hypothetical protein
LPSATVVPTSRREAQPELLGGVLVEAPLGQELPGLLRVRARELLGVVGLRDLVRLEHPWTQVALPLRGALPRALLVAELDGVLVGQPLDRLGEADAVDLHQEGDDVAALPAAEAVPDILRGVDVEGG